MSASLQVQLVSVSIGIQTASQLASPVARLFTIHALAVAASNAAFIEVIVGGVKRARIVYVQLSRISVAQLAVGRLAFTFTFPIAIVIAGGGVSAN